MPKLKINDIEVEVEQGTSILQAAKQIGIEIPHFCYHDKLSVPANCRMCLVEIEGGPPKPAASCAMACGEGMSVRTDSEMVKKARKGVMEMMLINHPLDCPICDQGGECDLQDQAMAYGFDRSRFHENKRAVQDKDLGPLVGTKMTRCINCTRCVRFAEEVAGTPVLGQLNRGEEAEIGTFIGELVKTELSGNLVDICPVGALTSKPYTFKARPWELRKTESIDVHDAVGSNIRVDVRGREVMRILPRLNEDVNEEWLGDRSRYSYDGLNKRRLDRPYIRDEKSGKLKEASWDEAFAVITQRLSGVPGNEIAGLVGDLAETESIVALKDLLTGLGSENMDCRTDGGRFDASVNGGYLFNSGISAIEDADAILIIGANPRHEATLVNARIRKTWMEKRIPVGLVGQRVDLTYPYEYLGQGIKDLDALNKVGDNFGKMLKNAERPMIIVGANIFAREDGLAIHNALYKMAEKLKVVKEGWNGFNVLQNATSRAGALSVGFVQKDKTKAAADILDGTKNGSIKALYLLGVDEFDARAEIGWQCFTIYQGHHGDRGAARADVILPGAAYTEKDGLYMNTEGRVQIAKKASFAPGDAREDWTILRALSERLGHALPYNDLYELRARIEKEWPAFSVIDELRVHDWAEFGEKGKVSDEAFANVPNNYYQANAICRASDTMAQCIESFGVKELPEAAE